MFQMEKDDKDLPQFSEKCKSPRKKEDGEERRG
jgi:hypothetical protein